jgi:hypothetical protein
MEAGARLSARSRSRLYSRGTTSGLTASSDGDHLEGLLGSRHGPADSAAR